MHNLDLNNSPLERGVAAKRTGCVTPLLRGGDFSLHHHSRIYTVQVWAGGKIPLLRGVPAKQAGCVIHQTVEKFMKHFTSRSSL